MGATVLFLLPQEIITIAITGTDLERKDLSANGNQLKKSSVNIALLVCPRAPGSHRKVFLIEKKRPLLL